MEYEVASTGKLTPGKMAGIEKDGKFILIANVDGTYYAVNDICTHMGCNLSGGILKGETVTCPCHTSIFNVKTGAVIKGPAGKTQAAFKTRVEGEKIFVSV